MSDKSERDAVFAKHTIQEDVRRAEAAMALRLKALKERADAPSARSNTQTEGVLTEVARSACPEAFWSGPRDPKTHPRGTTPPEWHTWWGLTEKHNTNIGKGYIPVVVSGEPVRHEELTLYKTRQEIYEAGINATAVESKARLASARDAGGEADKDARIAPVENEVQLSKGS